MSKLRMPFKNALSSPPGIGNCLLCALYLSQRSLAIPSPLTFRKHRPITNPCPFGIQWRLVQKLMHMPCSMIYGSSSYAPLNLNNWDWQSRVRIVKCKRWLNIKREIMIYVLHLGCRAQTLQIPYSSILLSCNSSSSAQIVINAFVNFGWWV